MKKSSSSCTIHYDEATNKQVKNSLTLKVGFVQKQIQLLNCIILKHLMGHATCVLLPEKLSSSLEDNEIPLPLSFESDGPHVIKTV